ncbi:MAG: hypothetical protein ACM3PW_09035 [Chlamydiota bacterium]
MPRNSQAGCTSRALVAAVLLTALLLVGGLQISAQAAPLGPVEHVLANRPPVTPAVTFDGPEFALIVAGRALAAPAFSQYLVLHPAPALEFRLSKSSRYIRPPPSA